MLLLERNRTIPSGSFNPKEVQSEQKVCVQRSAAVLPTLQCFAAYVSHPPSSSQLIDPITGRDNVESAFDSCRPAQIIPVKMSSGAMRSCDIEICYDM